MALEELRERIDSLDRRIIELLNERAEVAGEIGRVKRESRVPFYSPNREQEVYRKVVELSKGPLKEDCLKAIFREIMSGCLALEQPLKVACLGPVGTFSYQAAKHKFGESVEYVPTGSIDGVFTEVERGHADYGIVPIENSSEGAVTDTLDTFCESDLKICAEIALPIHHNLMAKCDREDIKKIYSKPQALGQCKSWLAQSFGAAELMSVGSTSEAARIAKAHSDEGAAAIAHEEAAKLFDLEIIAHHIEDNSNNVTRFLVLAHESGGKSGADKTSILCSIKDEVGALVGILLPFPEHKINLTKIESFPSKKKAWEYRFFIDMEGHYTDDAVQAALEKVKEKCAEIKILGSFPRDA